MLEITFERRRFVACRFICWFTWHLLAQGGNCSQHQTGVSLWNLQGELLFTQFHILQYIEDYSPCFWAVCVAETVWYLPPVLHYLILVLFCYSDSLKHHVPQWWYCCTHVKNNQCIDILYFPQVIRIQQVVFLVSTKQWYFIECFWRCTHNTVYIAFFFFFSFLNLSFSPF